VVGLTQTLAIELGEFGFRGQRHRARRSRR
jgi:hypothetical protein